MKNFEFSWKNLCHNCQNYSSRICVYRVILFSIILIGCNEKAPQKLTTVLQQHNGKPTLFINDQPHDGLFCSVQPPYMQNFIDAGFDIFDTHPYVPDGWIGDDDFDYTKTDEFIEKYLKQKPDAKLIIRFWMGYPYSNWWSKSNPDEIVITKIRQRDELLPSFASMKWREEAGEALSRVVNHIEQKYGNNVVAYVPGGGPNGEWFHWYAYNEDADRHEKGYPLEDYSEPMQSVFREFAQNKYGTVQMMNDAYGTRLNSFDQLEIPGAGERLNSKIGNLRNIREEQAVLDFYEIYNLQVTETLLHWAKKVKEGCERNKVVMAFYGYLWVEQPAGGVSNARSGHVDLDLVTSSPDVDYIVAPYHYSFRQLEGVMSGQGMPASVIRRGKQYVQEMDGSTYLKSCWPCRDHHVPKTPAESANILRRDVSKAMMEGASLWFMDLHRGMYDSPEMVSALKDVVTAARKHFDQSGHNNRQVAVVLNAKDAFYFRENEPLFAPAIAQFKQFELERMGLGYDDLIIANLKYLSLEETAQYKFWIFPSAVFLSNDQIELIKKHALRNGNHVLWVYAPGVLSNNGIDLNRLKEISGFNCGYTMEAGELAVKTIQSDHPFLNGRKSPLIYGTYGELSPDFIKYHSSLRHYPGSGIGFSITPRFFIEEADAILGNVLDFGNDKGGLGVKDMGDWVSILSVAPLVPKYILRNIAESAKCHVYTDFPGQTYQSRNYVGFFAHETGECIIRLPYPAKIVDVFNNRLLTENSQSVVLNVKINDAFLLHYEPIQPGTVMNNQSP